MKIIKNDCVGCQLPCWGDDCPLRRVEHWYCDKCGAELGDEIYVVDDEELCEDCLLEKFKVNIIDLPN
jgi:hypothetical protein